MVVTYFFLQTLILAPPNFLLTSGGLPCSGHAPSASVKRSPPQNSIASVNIGEYWLSCDETMFSRTNMVTPFKSHMFLRIGKWSDWEGQKPVTVYM